MDKSAGSGNGVGFSMTTGMWTSVIHGREGDSIAMPASGVTGRSALAAAASSSAAVEVAVSCRGSGGVEAPPEVIPIEMTRATASRRLVRSILGLVTGILLERADSKWAQWIDRRCAEAL